MPGRRKSNLGSKSRIARRLAMYRKNLTPEQLDEYRRKMAEKTRAKRAAETPEEAESRRRRATRRSQHLRKYRLSTQKRKRLQEVLNNIQCKDAPSTSQEVSDDIDFKPPKLIAIKDDMAITRAERQLALGRIVVEKLKKRIMSQEVDPLVIEEDVQKSVAESLGLSRTIKIDAAEHSKNSITFECPSIKTDFEIEGQCKEGFS